MDDEHVLQVLHRSLHPVVEGRSSLGVLQVQLVYRLQLLLCPLLAKHTDETQFRPIKDENSIGRILIAVWRTVNT